MVYPSTQPPIVSQASAVTCRPTWFTFGDAVSSTRSTTARRTPPRNALALTLGFAALAGIACGDSTGSSTPSEPAALAGITAAHNDARAAVGVGPLHWSAALAASAQAWADNGTDTVAPAGFLDNNPNRSVGFSYAVGENIAASSGTLTGASAVAQWVAEGANYNYAANTCSSGTCAHYTQVVWAATTEFGCGISNRPSLTFSHTIVCDYGPAGNTGGKPY